MPPASPTPPQGRGVSPGVRVGIKDLGRAAIRLVVVLWTQKLLQHLVAAIAKRLIGGVLAIAEPNLLLFGQGEFPRPQTSTFMTAIAQGLLTGKSAGAPEMVPGVKFHGNGCFIVYFG